MTSVPRSLLLIALLLCVTQLACGAIPPSAISVPLSLRSIGMDGMDVCGEDWVGILSGCSCYCASKNGKWAVGTKALCLRAYNDYRTRHRWCTRWMNGMTVDEDQLDKDLLATVNNCGASKLLTSVRKAQLHTTERLFFLGPVFAIVAKQAALAAARAAARAALAAARRAALAKARAAAARKAAQEAAKRAAKKAAEKAHKVARQAREARRKAWEIYKKKMKDFCKFKKKQARKEVTKVIECMCEDIRSGNLPASEEELKDQVLECVNPNVPEVCLANVAEKAKQGEAGGIEVFNDLQECF